MSFLKKLFGGGGARDGGAAATAETEEYKGFTIAAHPVSEGGQHRVSGTISKDVDGTRREARLDRADRMASRDEAVSMTFSKGRQVIDEQGDRLFG